MSRESKRNPILKVVAGGSMPMHVGGTYRPYKVWGYECECGKKAHHSTYGPRMSTRKQARDAYHRHRIKDHDGPGWAPDHHGAEPASPSPRQGLAETLAERDDSVDGSTPSPVTNPVAAIADVQIGIEREGER